MQNPLPFQDVAARWRAWHKAPKCFAAVHWRAESFRSTQGQPMPLRRAAACNAVLAQCTRMHVPGELLIGAGNLGRFTPAGTFDECQLKADGEYLATIGARDFRGHADHHAPDYVKLLQIGFAGLRREVENSTAWSDPARHNFLNAMLLALDGAASHMRAWGQDISHAAKANPNQVDLLSEQADRMTRLAEQAPRTFADALQLVLSYHYMMQLDDRYAMAFGRMDQYLYPFFQNDIADGRIDQRLAQDYLDHFFAKITVDGDVQNIALAGVKPSDGSDATNELSYMILEACKRVGQPGGNCTARIGSNTPPVFVEKCAEVIRTGIGYPAVFNDDLEIRALLDEGYPLEDARDYCFVGCIEVFIPGKMGPWADDMCNLPYCLNLAIFDGLDVLSGSHTGVRSGEPADFEQFYQAVLAQCRHHIDGLIAANNIAQEKFQARAEDFASPLMSVLVSDCISRGRDVNDGGARYPANNGFGAIGIGTVADSLAAVRKMVYQDRKLTIEELRNILKANYVGYEPQRQMLLRGAPKYGNDNDEVDLLAARMTTDIAAIFRPHRNPQGGYYWMLLASNVSNIYEGRKVAATPDGRCSGEPLSDAGSPTFGRDVRGPTATVRSIAKIPYHLAVGGNVVNVKLDPKSIAGEKGLRNLSSLILTCFGLGGSELQFNTTDRQTLIDAMANPQKHENLVVRVSGFSFNFTWLDRAVQEDILQRTEHSL